MVEPVTRPGATVFRGRETRPEHPPKLDVAAPDQDGDLVFGQLVPLSGGLTVVGLLCGGTTSVTRTENQVVPHPSMDCGFN